MQGIIVRPRLRWAEEGEKPTKYFCSLESRNYVNKIIPKIIQENGNIINKEEEILNAVRQFYKNLYENPTNNPEQDLDIINMLTSIKANPKLTREERDLLEGELTESEILTVLKKMKNNKSRN